MWGRRAAGRQPGRSERGKQLRGAYAKYLVLEEGETYRRGCEYRNGETIETPFSLRIKLITHREIILLLLKPFWVALLISYQQQHHLSNYRAL